MVAAEHKFGSVAHIDRVACVTVDPTTGMSSAVCNTPATVTCGSSDECSDNVIGRLFAAPDDTCRESL